MTSLREQTNKLLSKLALDQLSPDRDIHIILRLVCVISDHELVRQETIEQVKDLLRGRLLNFKDHLAAVIHFLDEQIDLIEEKKNQ